MQNETRSTRLTRRAMLGGLATVAAAPMLAGANVTPKPRTALHADLLTTAVPGGVYLSANANPAWPMS